VSKAQIVGNALPGEIMRRKSRKTGATVVLVDRDKISISDGHTRTNRWELVCTTHSVSVLSTNFVASRNRLPTADWCPSCQGIDAAVEALETPLPTSGLIELEKALDAVAAESGEDPEAPLGMKWSESNLRYEPDPDFDPRVDEEEGEGVALDEMTADAIFMQRRYAPEEPENVVVIAPVERVPEEVLARPTVSLLGQGASSAGLIAAVRKALTKARMRGEADVFGQRSFDATSYEALKLLAAEFVTLA
jgi:hypothetical protein